MRLNDVKIEISQQPIQEIQVDAYLLPYFSHHVNPGEERWAVELSGAKGVRNFIEYRLRRQINNDPLHLGHVLVVPSGGGKSKYIANLVCRCTTDDAKSKRDHKDCNQEAVASAIRRSLIRFLAISNQYDIKTIAMPALCVADGFLAVDFFNIVKDVLNGFSGEHSIEEIYITADDEVQLMRYLHILEA
ncbi:MAG: hypothetical protein E7018_01560 [Alphaproteobacteria bacterium]|nr:hypothetical protein [Alphaproteobacteria bacterium]